MAKSKIVKNYIYNTAYQLLLIITPLITAPYISRVLGVTGVSVANYVYSIVTYFILFGTVGSSLFGQREVAYYQDDPVKRSSVLKEIFAFRIVMVSASIAVYLLTAVRMSKYGTVYLLMIFELIATAFDISWFFQGMEDFKKTVVRNVVVKLAGIALIFLFVKSPEDVNKYAVCMTLPTLLGNLSLWAYLPKYIVKSPFSVKSVLGYVKPMLALFLPQIAMEVYTVLDKTMLGQFSANIDEVGYYTYSQHIVKMLLQIIASLGVVMLPAMANAFAKNDNKKITEMMGNSFKFVFMLGCPMMFGIAAVANNLVVWFYGDGYEPVGPLIMLISPIILIIGVSTITGRQFLLPTKRQSAFTVSVFCGAAVNFVLNLCLISRFGAIGASVATVVAEATVTAVQLFSVRKYLPLGKYFKENIKYLLFGAVMFAAVFALAQVTSGILGTVIQVAVGGAVYLLLLVVTKDEILFKYAHILLGKIKKSGR